MIMYKTKQRGNDKYQCEFMITVLKSLRENELNDHFKLICYITKISFWYENHINYRENVK